MTDASKVKKQKMLITSVLLFFCAALIVINCIIASSDKADLHPSPADTSAESVPAKSPSDLIRLIKFVQSVDTTTLIKIKTEPAYAVYIGDTVSPEVKLAPPSAKAQLSYSISDSDIASVDENGVITGVSEGRTTVLVSDSSSVSASYEIVVKKKMPDPAKDYPPLFDDEIMLVNGWNPIPDGYKPKVVSTMGVVPSKLSTLTLVKEALDSYAKMQKDCRNATGQKVILISGYRSVSLQKEILNVTVRKHMDNGYGKNKAKELAAQTVQAPGYSEHHIGLAVDIGTTTKLSDKLHETKAGAWMLQNAHKYGWILRYPSDKVELTGINYEPWHFRYVGTGHAEYIYSHNLCLEEYILLQKEAAENALEYSATHPATCD